MLVQLLFYYFAVVAYALAQNPYQRNPGNLLKIDQIKRLPSYNFGLGKRSKEDDLEDYDINHLDPNQERNADTRMHGLENILEHLLHYLKIRELEEEKRGEKGSDKNFGRNSRISENEKRKGIFGKTNPDGLGWKYGFGVGKKADSGNFGSENNYDYFGKFPRYESEIKKRDRSDNIGLRRMMHYEFGLGKRNSDYGFELGKRNPNYEFGLGKRIPADYGFGFEKRNPNYEFGLGKRISDYGFGLGKRNPNYEFGLGKRIPADYGFGFEKRNPNNGEFGLGKRIPTDFGLEKRNPNYEFGLGKRIPVGYDFGYEERNPNNYYEFGLGKRIPTDFGFGFEKRNPNYEFGLGKRVPEKYGFGSEKRYPSEKFRSDQQYNKFKFGLGKRILDYGFGLGKRGPNYNLGFGGMTPNLKFGLSSDQIKNYESALRKRMLDYGFGLGKRDSKYDHEKQIFDNKSGFTEKYAYPYGSNISKKDFPSKMIQTPYSFGVGKRFPIFKKETYNFGLGKRLPEFTNDQYYHQNPLSNYEHYSDWSANDCDVFNNKFDSLKDGYELDGDVSDWSSDVVNDTADLSGDNESDYFLKEDYDVKGPDSSDYNDIKSDWMRGDPYGISNRSDWSVGNYDEKNVTYFAQTPKYKGAIKAEH